MKRIIFSLCVIAGLLFCTKGHSQNKIFIKAVGSTGNGTAIGIFDGGSTAEKHPNEIEAIAYTDGLAGCAGPLSGGGGGLCKSTNTPFTFSMPLSFALISFKYNLVNGKFLNSVDMVIHKNIPSGFDFYKVHMEVVKVVSVSEGAGSDSLGINIELQPQKIAWEITKQLPDGRPGDKFSYGWDFSANKAFIYSF